MPRDNHNSNSFFFQTQDDGDVENNKFRWATTVLGAVLKVIFSIFHV